MDRQMSVERIFVQAIRHYCARHDIDLDVRADGWLIVMRRGAQRRFALGYDLGINSAIAHRLANDKSATADVLALSGVACIPHHFFLNPKLGGRVAAERSRRAMEEVLAKNPQGVVVKPNEGTSGRSVFKATSRQELEQAAQRIFSSNAGLVIAPYVDIEQELRVILLGERPMVVYSKERPSVIGDGKQTLRELAAVSAPASLRSAALNELDECELNMIVPAGARRAVNWRHNLDSGARPVLVDHATVRDTCVQLAIAAAHAIGIEFASIDVVRTGGAWKVLEINSSVMMEALGQMHPELAYATYGAALDRVFNAAPPESKPIVASTTPRRA
jgi:glutathione synthase/RimK-type ligase-like ATP-grasp enzyme